jgi:meiosis-specific APC/C activator protein AMA1
MEGVEYTNPPSSPLRNRRPGTLLSHAHPKIRPSRLSDRFVLDRTQPRERFILSTPPHQLTGYERRQRKQTPAIDPFGPSNRLPRAQELTPPSSASPPPFRTPSLFMSSRVNPHGPVRDSRNFSQGAVWNVGGSATANTSDRVRSVSNGRGGHITSGTNAPLFKSNFFNNLPEDLDGLNLHGKRLAAAMELDPANRILDQASARLSSGQSFHPSPIDPSTPTVWRDSEWTKPGSPSRKLIRSTTCCISA